MGVARRLSYLYPQYYGIIRAFYYHYYNQASSTSLKHREVVIVHRSGLFWKEVVSPSIVCCRCRWKAG